MPVTLKLIMSFMSFIWIPVKVWSLILQMCIKALLVLTVKTPRSQSSSVMTLTKWLHNMAFFVLAVRAPIENSGWYPSKTIYIVSSKNCFCLCLKNRIKMWATGRHWWHIVLKFLLSLVFINNIFILMPFS